jgi:predicted metal-binding membrane protein
MDGAAFPDSTGARNALRAILRRDRVIIAAGLFFITSVAWAYTVREARSMDELCMHMDRSWNASDVGMTLLMWIVMMVAMMTPSAAPMVLMFATVNEKRRSEQRPYAPAAFFLGGYLFVWSVFSIAATGVQWLLHSLALLSPMMTTSSPYLGACILFAAAVFQLTPLKTSCLAHCRSPLGFLLTDWRPGSKGAFLMGVHHGGYCTGCCWALMALLFVAGVMNLLWVALLSVFVLAEKMLPRSEMITRAASVALLLLAAATLKHLW